MIDYIIVLVCRFVYCFMKLKKTKNNKIVFLSRLSNDKTLDFSLIEKQLPKNLDLVFLCRRIEKMTDGIFKNIIYTIKSLYHLADAKVCVTDSYCLAISGVKHNKNLKIIQIWHSMGAIKKFGKQSVGNISGRSEKSAKILNIHGNYDYIISGSKEMTKYFSKAFGYSETKFLNYGLPRMDYLLNNNTEIKKKILKEYSQLKNKINILYVPTFRKTGEDYTSKLIENIDFKKYNLIIKSHENQCLKHNDKVLECKKFKALDLLCVADYVITDYSGIAIEAAIINKKTLYYLFDYEEYSKNTGINIDLFKEMPGCCFKDAKELIDFISNDKYKMKNLINFKNKYIDVRDGTSTEKIVKLICKCLRK